MESWISKREWGVQEIIMMWVNIKDDDGSNH